MTFDPKAQVLPESPVATPPRRGSILQLEDVSVRYDVAETPALDHLDLEVRAGEFLSILGPSGAGKTTALRVIAGFERVQSGYVRIGGRLVASSFTHVPPDKRRVGLVFQDYALFPHLTVQDNISFGLHDAERSAKDRRVHEMVELTGLAQFEKRYAHELSGGQQQRVALARALAPAPLAVLLDEPFSNLDRQLRSSLRREVRAILREAEATAVLVTHDREEALALADRIAVMGIGRIEQVGRPEDVYARPVSPAVANMIGPCVLLPGKVRGALVETSAGTFPAELNRANIRDGERVQALMRASELELADWDGGLEARIAYREFRGEFTEYGVSLPAGSVIRVRRRSRDVIEDGALVSVKARDGSKVIVFPESGMAG